MRGRATDVFPGIMLLLLSVVGCASNPSTPTPTTQRALATEPPKQGGALEATAELPSRLWDQISGNTPIKFARMMEDQQSPDNRRKGINRLVSRSFGRQKPYTTRYQQIAQFDEDWLVRAVALRALNRSRDRGATPIFIKALSDKNDLVRWEAAKALANVPDPEAAEPLARIVSNPADNKDVRIAAADALRHYHDPGVARALANTLNGRDFGVAWQARKSLIYLTGRDLHYNERAWMDYVSGAEKPLG
jgi:hypothetical protein